MKLLCLLLAAVHLYAQPATVMNVAADIVTVETADGNLWEYYGDAPGESLIVLMHDSGTADPTDDSIVCVTDIHLR